MKYSQSLGGFSSGRTYTDFEASNVIASDLFRGVTKNVRNCFSKCPNGQNFKVLLRIFEKFGETKILFLLFIGCLYVLSWYEMTVLYKFYRNWPSLVTRTARGNQNGLVRLALVRNVGLYINSCFGPTFSFANIFCLNSYIKIPDNGENF